MLVKSKLQLYILFVSPRKFKHFLRYISITYMYTPSHFSCYVRTNTVRQRPEAVSSLLISK
jgi:hypothetical protein